MQATSIMAASPYPTFLYPKSRQFPVDEVCEKIVRALEKRNWKVPGVQVKFNDSGTGELKYRYVSIIKGADFRLWFCRIQGRISYWKNDVAAITEISIPKRELHVYDDESGPTYFTYVGDNWEEDKEKFMNASKYCNTVNGEKKSF
ncbi:MAG: hypothetical protein VX777_02040 [Chlamydiota bacterium]|nr:hypothetical protein [Chlamydiota bacterium]